MPSVERIFDPIQREQIVNRLRESLQTRTIADLREAARRWGWPVRGTSKAALTEQLLGYLQDPSVMSAAAAALPPDQALVLAWLVVLRSRGDSVRQIQVCLQYASGVEMAANQINRLLIDLYDRGLLITGSWGLEPSALYLEWLPPIRGEALHASSKTTRATAPQGLGITVEWIADEVQRLLSAIEEEKPTQHRTQENAPQTYDRLGRGLLPRTGLLSPQTLGAWGYSTPDQRSLAALLAELLSAMRIIVVDSSDRVLPVPSRFDEWQRREPFAQLQLLRATWLKHPEQYGVDNWNELDMALGQIERFQFRLASAWNQAPPLYQAVLAFRQRVIGILQALEPDVWYSFERFCRLISELSRDPLASTGQILGWAEGGKLLQPTNMPFDVWMATYGQLLAALLHGPARWLGFVEIDGSGRNLVGFRRPSALEPGDLVSVPPDTLRFIPPDTVILRKTWKGARLRPILARIARETATDQARSTFRLDPAAFRAFLQAGGDAEGPLRELAANGFPLPSASADKLKRWESRHGRYQLYENLAVIELAEDIAQAEVEALARQLGSRLYEVAPRCLLVLNRDQTPTIIDELRRRGYTPKVTS